MLNTGCFNGHEATSQKATESSRQTGRAEEEGKAEAGPTSGIPHGDNETDGGEQGCLGKSKEDSGCDQTSKRSDFASQSCYQTPCQTE